ncbi:hypothetical protein [Curvivirga aplysinae]|uniref:hypothetical protein n=1 Tax=Curvivirga aplysinae TaxID=2529852 RepID=UPI0012BBBA6E|nr:hypothetical protein [Curvivirga aplysinae]MTI10189.1 hypothetical protein [Curvivirga aplysinae]
MSNFLQVDLAKNDRNRISNRRNALMNDRLEMDNKETARNTEVRNALSPLYNQLRTDPQGAIDAAYKVDGQAGHSMNELHNQKKRADWKDKWNKHKDTAAPVSRITKSMMAFMDNPDHTEEQKAEAYAGFKQLVAQSGIPMGELPESYNPQLFETMNNMANSMMDPEKYGKATKMVDPDTGEVVYVQLNEYGEPRELEGYVPPMDQPKPQTTLAKAGQDLKNGLITQAGYDQVAAGVSKGRGVTVNNVTHDVGEEQKQWSKSLVSNYEGIRDTATSSQTSLYSLQGAEKVLDSLKPGETLPMGLKQAVGNIAQWVGLDPDSVVQNFTESQQFSGLMGNMVLEKLAQQKGPQTDKDAERIMETVATLGNTPEAQKYLIKVAKQLAQRDIGKFQFYRQFRRQNGTLEGAEDDWFDEMISMPPLDLEPEVMAVANPSVNKDGIPYHTQQAQAPTADEPIAVMPDGTEIVVRNGEWVPKETADMPQLRPQSGVGGRPQGGRSFSKEDFRNNKTY